MTAPTRPLHGPEVQQLLATLRTLRRNVLASLEGLEDADLRRAVLPSGWTLLGLVQHLAYVERFWRDTVVDGRPDAGPWADEDPDAEWRVPDDVPADDVVAFYREQAQATDERFADADLDARVAWETRPHDLRSVLIHLVEETAQHAGHADVVRELLDAGA